MIELGGCFNCSVSSHLGKEKYNNHHQIVQDSYGRSRYSRQDRRGRNLRANLFNNWRIELDSGSRYVIEKSNRNIKLQATQPNTLSYSNETFKLLLAASLAIAFVTLIARANGQVSTTGAIGISNVSDIATTSFQLTPDLRACITATYLCVSVVNNTWIDCNLLEALCNQSTSALIATDPNRGSSDNSDLIRRIVDLLIPIESVGQLKFADINQLFVLSSDVGLSVQNDGPGSTVQSTPIEPAYQETQYLKPRQAEPPESGLSFRIAKPTSDFPVEQIAPREADYGGLEQRGHVKSETNQMSHLRDPRWFGSSYLGGHNRLPVGSSISNQKQASTEIMPSIVSQANLSSTDSLEQTYPDSTWILDTSQTGPMTRPSSNPGSSSVGGLSSALIPSWLGRPFRSWGPFSFWSSSGNLQFEQEADVDGTKLSTALSEPSVGAKNMGSTIQILRPIDRSEHSVSLVELTSNQSAHVNSPSQHFQTQAQVLQAGTVEDAHHQLSIPMLQAQSQLKPEKLIKAVESTPNLMQAFGSTQDSQTSGVGQMRQLQIQAAKQNSPNLVPNVYDSMSNAQTQTSGSAIIFLKAQENQNQPANSPVTKMYENSLFCRCDELLTSDIESRQDLVAPEVYGSLTILSGTPTGSHTTDACRLKCSMQSQQTVMKSQVGAQTEDTITQEPENSVGFVTDSTQVPYPSGTVFNQHFSGTTNGAGLNSSPNGGNGGGIKVTPLEVNFFLYTRYHRDLSDDLAQLIGAGPHNIASVAASNLVSTGEKLDPSNETTLGESRLNASLPIKIVIHGFGSGGRRAWVADMVYKILEYEDVNVIVVDWEKGATLPNYVHAAGNTRLVGHKTASLIKLINAKFGLTGNSYHLIGFSLGAHVAGFAGMEIRNVTNLSRMWINRITGLDPASPLFEGYEANDRLDPGDAQFVDVIHSNGDGVLRGGFGSLQPMGHVDFYPNGGRVQVGCNSVLLSALSDIISGKWQSLCNHRRALNFFMDSFEFNKCRFRSFNCDSYESFLRGECFDCGPNNEKCSYMGYLANYSKGRGKMYLTTHEDAPFCANQLLIRVVGTRGYRTNWGKVEVTLLTIDGKNESFWLSSSMNQPSSNYDGMGSIQRENSQVNLQSLIVTHPTLVNFTQIQLKYNRYKGWIYSGDVSWSIDKILLMDSDGQMKSYCNHNTVLESHVTTRLSLEPGNCTVTEPYGEQQNTSSSQQPSSVTSQQSLQQMVQPQVPQSHQNLSKQAQMIAVPSTGMVANVRTARLMAAILDSMSQAQMANVQVRSSAPVKYSPNRQGLFAG